MEQGCYTMYKEVEKRTYMTHMVCLKQRFKQGRRQRKTFDFVGLGKQQGPNPKDNNELLRGCEGLQVRAREDLQEDLGGAGLKKLYAKMFQKTKPSKAAWC